MLVAERQGAVIGFCAPVAPARNDDAGGASVAEIAALYVDPRAWRSGAGRGLMQTALADLRAGGWKAVTLWVLSENAAARAFYAGFGFTPDGTEMTEQRSGRAEVRLRASLRDPANGDET